MHRLLLILPALLLTSGCATTPTALSQATPVPADRLLALQSRTADQTATLVVTRDSGILGSGCYLSLLVNGTHAARFGVGETATLHVSPGEMVLRSGFYINGRGLCALGSDAWTQRETTLREGETKRFRFTIDTSGRTDERAFAGMSSARRVAAMRETIERTLRRAGFRADDEDPAGYPPGHRGVRVSKAKATTVQSSCFSATEG